MRQNGYIPDTANAIARYFDKAALPTQQETLGQIVVEILRDGRLLNKKVFAPNCLVVLKWRPALKKKVIIKR